MSQFLPYDQQSKTVAIHCSALGRMQQLQELAVACGCRVAPMELRADYLLCDISSDSDRAGQECTEIADYLNHYGAEALVWIEMDQLETAYAALPPERCHWLVDADDALAVPILAKASRRDDMDQLHDQSRDGRSRDSEYGALHRISDDLADFARTLARIADQEDGLAPSVRDKPVSFRPAPSALFKPLVAESTRVEPPSAAKVRDLIKLRRLRDHHFPASVSPQLYRQPQHCAGLPP